MLLPTCAETTARERGLPSLASKKPPRGAEGSVKPTVVAMQVKTCLPYMLPNCMLLDECNKTQHAYHTCCPTACSLMSVTRHKIPALNVKPTSLTPRTAYSKKSVTSGTCCLTSTQLTPRNACSWISVIRFQQKSIQA